MLTRQGDEHIDCFHDRLEYVSLPSYYYICFYHRYRTVRAQYLLLLGLSWSLITSAISSSILLQYQEYYHILSICGCQTILLVLVLLSIFISSSCLSHVHLLSILVAISTSFTALLVSYYFPVYSLLCIFLLVFFLQTSLPLPHPLGTCLAVLVTTIHLVMIMQGTTTLVMV